MPNDIASLLCALMVNLVTMAVALPAVMGRVSPPARHAQLSVALQAAGWALLGVGVFSTIPIVKGLLGKPPLRD